MDLSHLRYVTIEGCIGVGKTTLTHLLSRSLGAHTVLEVVEENPFLPDFYKDKVAHAFKTQMFFLLSRFKQQDQLAQTDLFQQRVVSDYLFAKDRIFAELTLSPSELGLYNQIFHVFQQRIQAPDLVIYLHAPMDVILERIRMRGRAFEQSIDRGYLEDLVAAYGRFFASFDEAPLLMIDTAERNFPARETDLDVVLSTLRDFPKAGERRRIIGGSRAPERQPNLV
jgi:deoxyadenosine/deoxycytidine kinase